jgi:Zn-dependent protease
MLFAGRDPAFLVAALIALLVGLTFHEFSHARLADELGDRGPRALGRVSLNPLRHIDPIGGLMILIAGFGWAKPVPVNPYALRPGRRGMAIVAAAGPLANVAVAIGFAIVFRAMESIGVGGFLLEVVWFVVIINVILALFNLLPIPPLDGYNVVLPFLDRRTAMTVSRYAPYGVFVLLLLIILPESPLRLLFTAARSIADLLVGA